ncbi:hypothetical protein SADUNF_Sadunf01G0103400 [Salix dunnii]|uniref:Protein kinase domain-containing protein n=1 Tax=Salix dunnii TaxID=1413687 RepID=A0A835NAU4_9ROSI|nr:hypothetical protein SADUNF_Sadunf01G0103400 [Salix dunnii]
MEDLVPLPSAEICSLDLPRCTRPITPTVIPIDNPPSTIIPLEPMSPHSPDEVPAPRRNPPRTQQCPSKFQDYATYAVRIEMTSSKKGFFLNQRKYTLDVLQDAGMLSTKPSPTLVDSKLKLSLAVEDQTFFGNFSRCRTSKSDLSKNTNAPVSSFRRLSFSDLSRSSSTRINEDLAQSFGPDLFDFQLSELRAITQNFSSNFLLGEGGFGTVHKGYVDGNLRQGLKAQAVAVKLLDIEGLQGHREWLHCKDMAVACGQSQASTKSTTRNGVPPGGRLESRGASYRKSAPVTSGKKT